jgi:hypothetical protein
MKHPLLSTLLAVKPEIFVESYYDLLTSRGFSAFTIWGVENGSICVPIKNFNGIDDGTFDIYDLGYSGEDVVKRKFVLTYFDASYTVYAVIFFSVSKKIRYALTLHTDISIDAYEWLSALRPVLEVRLNEMHSSEQKMYIYVDYQKKIDFVKDCTQILKILSVKDIVVNALNYFSETFCAEAGCAFYKDSFEGFGVTEKDLETSISVNSVPLLKFITEENEIGYFEERLYSEKFNISNLFIIKDHITGVFFVLFNITADPLPDREFSLLISSIVAIAIDNAIYHERKTLLLVEEKEMSQTVDILNRFVMREKSVAALKLFGANYPAKSTGGDYFNVIEKGDKVFVCVADVCGKGYSAAVFTVMLAAIIETECEEIWDLAALVKKINTYMLGHSFDERFITGVFSIYDKADGTLSYIGCGHEPVFLVRNGKSAEQLMSAYLPLGLVSEEYKPKSVALSEGDLVFIYTDGVVEYISYDLLAVKLMQNSDRSPDLIVKSLYNELVATQEKQRDDFTAVALIK